MANECQHVDVLRVDELTTAFDDGPMGSTRSFSPDSASHSIIRLENCDPTAALVEKVGRSETG